MELKQLEYFMAVCRYGSLGKAAGKLYTTQPNVSKVIHQLEADLGQPLFERTSKGLRLTAFGKSTYPYAEAILKNVDLLRQEEKKERQEEFNISAYRSHVLARLLVQLHKARPDMVIHHRQGTVEEITNHVSQGLSELGILYVSQKQLKEFRHIIRHKRLEFSELCREPVCVYVGPRSPYYQQKQIPREDVSKLRFMQELSDFFSMEHHLEQVSMGVEQMDKMHALIYTNSEHFTTALVEETEMVDLGIDLPFFEEDHAALRHITVEGLDDMLVLGYVVEKNHTLSQPAQELIDMFRRQIRPSEGPVTEG